MFKSFAMAMSKNFLKIYKIMNIYCFLETPKATEQQKKNVLKMKEDMKD